MKPVIVYGLIPDEAEDYYTFLKEPHARDALACWVAFNTARTWREFWEKLPTRYHWRLNYPESTDPEYDDPDNTYPTDETPFDRARLSRDTEGEFPPLAHTEAAAAWMPEEIVERYGENLQSLLSGDWVLYPPEHAEAVADELKRRGYEVRHDPDLIKYTCSHLATDAK